MSDPHYPRHTELAADTHDMTTSYIHEVAATLGAEPANVEPGVATPLPPGRLAAMHRMGIFTLISRGEQSDRDEIEGIIRQQREAAAEFPSSDEGLDIAGVYNFFARRGLTIKPITVLTEDNVDEFKQLMLEVDASSQAIRDLGATMPGTNLRILGHYSVQLGRTLVLRPNRELTLYERFQLNKIIAHESAHSTTDGDPLMYFANEEDAQYCYATSGFLHMLTDKYDGNGTEEAYAELKAADYVRNELGMPNGLWGGRKPRVGHMDGVPPIPLVYLNPGDETMSTASMLPGAILAFALEQIAEVRPELHTALDAARNSVEGRREVARIIESIQPGLYTKFLKLQEIDTVSYAKLCMEVEKALGRR